MLLQIRDYITREKIASDQQIAREFQMDVLALQPLLDLWLRKGVISRCERAPGCKKRCVACQVVPEYYQINK